jgi:D-beta-D-heptose 7-phosphate kinase/D-beta-D-heptose 1-phosphate adenosyltransferase
MKHIISNKRALEIIGKFSRSRVLVIGDIMADHFIWGGVSRISPEAPVPVVEVKKESFLLGGCANVFNNIAAMGGQVELAGVIGADDIGRRLLRDLSKRGVETKGVIVEDDRPTTLKTRIVAHGQQVVRFDREERRAIAEATIGQIVSYVESLRDGLGALVISDYNKGVVVRPLLDRIRTVIAGRAIVTCVDPKQRDFSLYEGFDIITPNHHEAGLAAAEEMLGPADYIRVGTKLLEQNNLKALLMTRGEEGMSLFEKTGVGAHQKGQIRHTDFPTQAREVFDVTGAGDTVIGVLALGLAAGATLREAVYLANHAAGIAVGKAGTATVTREELKLAL